MSTPAVSSAGQILVLNEQDVSSVTDQISPERILRCVGRSMHAFTACDQKSLDLETPEIQNPLRLNILTPKHNMLFMPSRLGSESTTSIKVVSVPRSADDKTGLPASTLVFDESSGQLQAIMNARALTAVRTAAASALALSLVPNVKQAKTLLVFGAGLQAHWHARLVASLASDLQRIVIASRSHSSRSDALVQDLQKIFPEQNLEISGCLIEEAVRSAGVVEQADLVCCCTPSVQPLFSAARLKSGAGLAMIGSYKPHMREVNLLPLFSRSQAGSKTSRIIVDSKSACLAEAGELYHLREHDAEVFGEQDECLVELGSLVDSEGAAKTASGAGGGVTVFKCVGMGVMDSAISGLVLKEAHKLNLGAYVPF